MGEPLTMFTAGDRPADSVWNANWKNARDGLLELVTVEAIDTTSVPKPFYISSNGWIGVCDGNDQTKLEFVGFVKKGQNIGAGEFIQVYMGEGTIVGGFSGLTRGSKYYVQDDQTIGTAPGTYDIFVGYAISATEILIAKECFQYIGSASDGGDDIIDVPAAARFALVYMELVDTATGETTKHTFWLARNGLNDDTFYNVDTATGGPYSVSGRAQWITTTITLTQSGGTSVSGTAYFYR